MNGDFTRENVVGEDGNTFEAYVTEFTHTTTDEYDGKTYTSKMQMIVNPETGATIVGNPNDGFYLSVPDESGNVREYVVMQNQDYNEASMKAGAAQDIRDLAYLINSDFVNADGGTGALGTYQISSYGPNRELNEISTGGSYGETQKMIINGKEVEVALFNPENSYNFTNDFDFTKNYKLTDKANTPQENPSGENTPTTDQTTTGGAGTSSNSYSSAFAGAEGIFQQGLNGQATADFPWISTEYADAFRTQFIEEGTFSGMYTYEQFRSLIDEAISTANQGINLIMSENGSGKKVERVNALREASQLTEEFQRAKESMDSQIYRDAIVRYNDNVEQAKVEKTRKLLRQACEDYNNTNTKVVSRYTTTDYDGARADLGDRRGSIYRGRTSEDGVTEYHVSIYDKIDYDGAWSGIDFGWGLFNMKTDRMVVELEARGVHVQLEDRPDNTR